MSIFSSLSSWVSNVVTWWEGTTIGQEIDAAAKAAITELESLTASELESITENTASAMLPVIASGGSVPSIIAVGLTAAEAAFKTSASKVASTTVSTFVATLHNSISAQQPAPAAPASK
jgi:hypothetical protein